MFERFTERARLAMFYGRFEAGTLGSQQIETEHLLAGIIFSEHPPERYRHTQWGTASRATAPFFSDETAATLTEEIETLVSSEQRGEPKPETVDMWLSSESKASLGRAAEKAGRKGPIHELHLLYGLAQDSNSTAAKLLAKHGITLSDIDAAISAVKE